MRQWMNSNKISVTPCNNWEGEAENPWSGGEPLGLKLLGSHVGSLRGMRPLIQATAGRPMIEPFLPVIPFVVLVARR